jgi:hypothetical protein
MHHHHHHVTQSSHSINAIGPAPHAKLRKLCVTQGEHASLVMIGNHQHYHTVT